MADADTRTSDTDRRVRELGLSLRSEMRGEVPGIFNQDFWQGRILEWAMRDASFRADLFRLVDVLPALNTRRQMWRHLKDHLLVPGRELPAPLRAALKAASGGLTGVVAVELIRRNVARMARNFIAGKDAFSALPVLKGLNGQGIGFTADLLGEAVLSPEEADGYRDRYFDLIDTLSAETAKWPHDPVLERGLNGPLPLANVSLKLSALDSRLDPVDAPGAVARLKKAALPIFLRAKALNVFLNVDMEQWQLHDLTYDFFEEMLAEPELRGWPHLGIVVQAYLLDSARDVDRLLSLAKGRGTPITVRLVKGAYWDYEVTLARQLGLPCPVFLEKWRTDARYEQLSEKLLREAEHLQPAFGSHNLRSLAHALVKAGEMNAAPEAYEVQMLYGMAEPERKVLRRRGHRVRVYAPLGELLPGMAYLVRRLLENTSNSGFLRLSYREGEDMENLLAAPHSAAQAAPAPQAAAEGRAPSGAGAGESRSNYKAADSRAPTGMRTPFQNCSVSDFARAEVRAAFARAVEEAAAHLPWRVPVIVNGESRFSDRPLERESPNDLSRRVALVTLATSSEVERAAGMAYAAFPAWRDKPLSERAALLKRLGEALEDRRYELAALQTWEEAKPWKEADADVAEAVDFCRYYAEQALEELAPRVQGVIPGEHNLFLWQGRGPTAVIAPWNFPLAILTGMTAAALAAGNPVLLKPAEQSSAMAFMLFQALREAGLPKEAAHFLPGLGEEAGAALVAHPLVAQVAFTGSMEVGLKILEAAARVQPGQPQLKRVVCEMGGKNAIIVDEDADLDEAVGGVVKSAFAYAGQKCSACSRVITVGQVHGDFTRRLVGATRALVLAPAVSPACDVPPVIDGESFRRLRAVKADPGARVLFAGEDGEGGHFIAPAIYEVDDAGHRLMQEELFGPLLAVINTDSFEQALEIAGAVPYALTGGVYSRSPSHLELARERFQVGNLYLNRPSTGALVARQPFGGFRMSGLGTKAGGPGYLLQFAEPRCITENTMRRGFSPEISS